MSDKDFDDEKTSSTASYDLNEEFSSEEFSSDPDVNRGAVFFTVKPGDATEEFKSNRMKLTTRSFNEKDIKGLLGNLSNTAKNNGQLTKKVKGLWTPTGSRARRLQMADFSDDVVVKAGKRRRRKHRKTIKRKPQRRKRTQRHIRK